MLQDSFFARDAVVVAKELLGKVLCVKHKKLWLTAKIIETEAYYMDDKASHASLGYTEKRSALFMSPGTIYMYYSRAGDSLNVSCSGAGNAVLIKAAYPYFDAASESKTQRMLSTMQKLCAQKATARQGNAKSISKLRPITKLCAGQALLCRSLGLKVKDWDQKNFSRTKFYIDDVSYQPAQIIQTRRLGIAEDRDAHLEYRFIDFAYAAYCTSNPLRKKK